MSCRGQLIGEGEKTTAILKPRKERTEELDKKGFFGGGVLLIFVSDGRE